MKNKLKLFLPLMVMVAFLGGVMDPVPVSAIPPAPTPEEPEYYNQCWHATIEVVTQGGYTAWRSMYAGTSSSDCAAAYQVLYASAARHNETVVDQWCTKSKWCAQ